ncbi:hypothetical protein BSR28_07935 [Boudabousia liubingyangii]|nr:hypothetical protein BSR28_07935 [Boudabousia liubingyangii]
MVLAGILSLTAFKADSKIVAQTPSVAKSQLVYTSGGVLPLFSGPVKVTATVPEGKEVTLLTGRPYDVALWAATKDSTDVVGLANWSTLETKHQARKAEKDEPPLSAFSSADAWQQNVTAKGTASLELSDPIDDLSVMAFCVDCEQAPVMTLEWPYRFSSTFQWVILTLGVLITILAVLAFLFLRRREHQRQLTVGGSDSETEPKTEDESRPTTAELEIQSIKAVTGEIHMPRRRALREARLRGENEVEVEGVKYPTGALPKVLEDMEKSESAAGQVVVPEDANFSSVEAEIAQAKAAATSTSDAGEGTGERPVSFIRRRRRGNSAWQKVADEPVVVEEPETETSEDQQPVEEPIVENQSPEQVSENESENAEVDEENQEVEEQK